jgi:uncharacterized membrane protein YfcA
MAQRIRSLAPKWSARVQSLLDHLVHAASNPALWPLAALVVIGGVVRGFTGFGFAMVFIPVASMLVGPVAAVALVWVIDMPFALPLAARSLRRADWREVVPLVIGSTAVMPLGVWLLTTLDRGLTRWIIALAIAAALAALVSGWRYAGAPGRRLSLGVGGLSGLTSGLAGLGGVPLAIFWLGAQDKSAGRARDNLQVFFLLTTFTAAAIYGWRGVLTAERFALGALLCLPYAVGLTVGVKGYGVASEQTFRRIAYGVIALSVFASLPLWDSALGR